MARPRQEDLAGVEGPGVSPARYKDIDRLADKFIETRDEKADLAGKLTKIEGQIAELMVDHQITKYTFSDQEVILKPGKTHVKVRTIKTEGADNGEESAD